MRFQFNKIIYSIKICKHPQEENIIEIIFHSHQLIGLPIPINMYVKLPIHKIKAVLDFIHDKIDGLKNGS